MKEKEEDLLKKVRMLGVPLMELKETVDANATLAEVAKSREERYWEIFPVLLANSANRGWFDYRKSKQLLRGDQRSIFNKLVLLSLVLYRVLDLEFPWTDELVWKYLPFSHDEYEEQVKRFVDRDTFVIAGKEISPDSIANIFRNYFYRIGSQSLKDLLSRKEELGLEHALSQIFSPKQKELFLKKLRGERFSKSEREYFSRTVKKKVQALANEQLHHLAKNI